MKSLKHFDYYLVLDLEATCCDKGSIARNQMEIIEIGAVMVDSTTLTIVDEFQTFVKPVRHPILTEFCTALTSIAQTEVDRAPTYPEASAMLKNWLSGYPNGVFGSWGDYDRKQFKKDSNFHQLPFPIACPHINLKQLFSETQGLPKRYGMEKALELAALPLEGTHHRGIDDARNIAKLLPYILRQKNLT
ncbi:MAG: exonuclease domain-containing protein [Microcoleus sp. PH2017_01_SCD_O_A]|uniref:3'-5' exonuclease n=1 Tax=unclassified Microcoleus TaxID=2642155 RepID=UPI001E07C517|nr:MULTISPECIES: 3'-5' exonuclease [unclassified Microcoleus]TAE09728.1 MAG: exonuclease [Oscillatoriales cyanobacterium]MCC3426177.1 exonuclease domain-containing protein [Microcoleus sp. PH2017_01_SCD_O_A]MCC3492481.1 exonuclease domain-containing protein [Microcoleus sp. PH2017_16_JOR_D_A]MCC3535711.1 exonuclease domain-containing protein [Microcoleus sp. PH2017_25_DOB_D_A]MCC3547829.1 exonuclease domain-containing protein [Microcoleus sp. PH2017_24_DOB_U_A]